jgi:transposase
MSFTFFVGIDIGKETLEVALFKGGEELQVTTVANTMQEIKSHLAELQKTPGFHLDNTIFCMEHTGVYNNPMLAVLHKHKAQIWVEHAEQILRSIGMTRGKNDKMDARRIAKYAHRFADQARLWQPVRQVVQELSVLSSLRDRLVAAKKQISTPLKELSLFVDKRTAKLLESNCKSSLVALEKDISAVEQKIKGLIDEDPEIKELHRRITSVPGVGDVTATAIIVATNEFKDFNSPKKFACHAGVAPFEHRSGISIRGKTQVSKKANKKLKTLLHLAARSILATKGELRQYFDRKVAEGKAKMAVLNAIGNKIILRIFAVIRDEVMYQKNYQYSFAKP